MPAAPRATLARVFTIQDIEGMFAYSRCHIYRLMRANKIPLAVNLDRAAGVSFGMKML